jgi:putative endonuclease
MPRRGWLYILRCADDSYYVGSTTNVEARVLTHQAGDGGDYTSKRLPVTVVYAEEFATLHDAFLAERQVKGWTRAKKEALIRRDYGALPELAMNSVLKALLKSEGSK